MGIGAGSFRKRWEEKGRKRTNQIAQLRARQETIAASHGVRRKRSNTRPRR